MIIPVGKVTESSQISEYRIIRYVLLNRRSLQIKCLSTVSRVYARNVEARAPAVPTPGCNQTCSGSHVGLINESRCHWRMGSWGRKKNRSLQVFSYSAQYYILCMFIWLASPPGCSGWTRTPSWNLSVKVSLRSPVLFFLIKLIRWSATGARLTAARDLGPLTPTRRLSSRKIAGKCGPLGWSRQLKALGMLQASQPLLPRQFFKFLFFFSPFFHFLLLLSPSSQSVAPDLISGAINVELCPVVFTICLHMFRRQKPPAHTMLMLLIAWLSASHVIFYLLVNKRAGSGFCPPPVGCLEHCLYL